MDKIWISTLIGALTGGFTGCTGVVLFTMPLWTILVVYPLVGLATAGLIYVFWVRIEVDSDQDHDSIAARFGRADLLVK